jgi:ribosomal protein L6P/L9E
MKFPLRSAALLLCGLLTACGGGGGSSSGGGGGDNNPPPASVAVTGVSLNQSTINLTVGGGTATLTATVEPGNATNKGVSYSSDAPTIASVNASTGVVTPVAVGSAKITVTTADGGKTASSSVTVAAAGTPTVSVTGVAVTPGTLNLTVGGSTATLTATVAPANATNRNVSWSSDAPGIASVNTNTGLVTPLTAGSAKITATTVDGNKTAFSTVTVAAVGTLVITSFTPTQARHGETVTLIGTGFSAVAAGDNLVTFNGHDVQVTAATATQLKVTVPKNMDASGLVKVTVAGKTAVAVESFTYVPTYVVSTLAGDGTSGFKDDVGEAARFNLPQSVAFQDVPSLGGVLYLFVADWGNNRIRAVTPSGVVTTLAGSTAGFKDDTGAAAQFTGPAGVAMNPSPIVSNAVYVADRDNHRIRKVSLSGVVTTLAGSGTGGFKDDTGTAAQFNGPFGIAVDVSENVYVADYANHRIRKISPAGVVTTLAGSGERGFADGTGAEAKFANPTDVAVDGAGNVYVGDSNNYRVRKITPAGVVTTLAGGDYGFKDDTGTAAQFRTPYGVAVDAAGNVFVSDSTNNSIRKISPAGVVTTIAGTGEVGHLDGTGAEATFNNPKGLAVDSAGNVYVADTTQSIRKLMPE